MCRSKRQRMKVYFLLQSFGPYEPNSGPWARQHVLLSGEPDPLGLKKIFWKWFFKKASAASVAAQVQVANLVLRREPHSGQWLLAVEDRNRARLPGKHLGGKSSIEILSFGGATTSRLWTSMSVSSCVGHLNTPGTDVYLGWWGWSVI